MDVNLIGPINATRAALPLMTAQGHGHLITVASATAVKPLAGMTAYSASKAGLLAFNEALRRELRHGPLHVSTILPYLADTDAGRGLRPQPR
jgi:short-subunit dehydrogenase